MHTQRQTERQKERKREKKKDTDTKVDNALIHSIKFLPIRLFIIFSVFYFFLDVI